MSIWWLPRQIQIWLVIWFGWNLYYPLSCFTKLKARTYLIVNTLLMQQKILALPVKKRSEEAGGKIVEIILHPLWSLISPGCPCPYTAGVGLIFD